MMYLLYTLNEPDDIHYPNMSDLPMCHHLHIAGLTVNHVCAVHHSPAAIPPPFHQYATGAYSTLP
jgi:hypothetical protein